MFSPNYSKMERKVCDFYECRIIKQKKKEIVRKVYE